MVSLCLVFGELLYWWLTLCRWTMILLFLSINPIGGIRITGMLVALILSISWWLVSMNSYCCPLPFLFSYSSCPLTYALYSPLKQYRIDSLQLFLLTSPILFHCEKPLVQSITFNFLSFPWSSSTTSASQIAGKRKKISTETCGYIFWMGLTIERVLCSCYSLAHRARNWSNQYKYRGICIWIHLKLPNSNEHLSF